MMKLDLERYTLHTRVLWLMIIRLIVITVSLLIGVAVKEVMFGKFYHYIHFYYIISLLYIILLQRARQVQFLGAFQIGIDLLAITSIVLSTDPIYQVYGNLFILVILTSNIVFPKYGGMLTALLSSLLYCGTVLYNYYYYQEVSYHATGDYAIYVTYLYVTIFLGVGYLSSYVSRMLAQKTEELRQLQEQSGYVFCNINTGMLIVDENGFVVYANPAAGRIVQHEAEELRNMHWHCLLGINDTDGASTRERLQRGQEVEVRTCDRLGNEIEVAAAVSPITHPAVMRYCTVLFRDLREQREHERRLRDTNRLGGIVELAATIAHEIRNPLTSLSGSAELLQERIHEPDARRLLTTIIHEVERLDAIVEDFVTFTRLRSMVFQHVDLNEVLTELAVLLYHNRRFKPNTKIIYRELNQPLPVVLDPRQFKQALLNIGLNALDAMPHGGELELVIDAAENSEMITITLRDTGCGIPAEVRQRIFEPFFSTKENGSGIGLYVTQRIIESHHGTITVASEVGKGTLFCVKIPRTITPEYA
jgi:two-component system sensor histidine kinase PilS (NtrC family)